MWQGYRRVPPAHYQKLRQVLTEMEEQEIIRKYVCEYAYPLVMVWKKDGGLRICTDFRWLNARTHKDAHPLPHQSDCLEALGGYTYFSTMDLTSGFYNIPMCEEDKKYTAFTTPLGLHEYNRMPQGLCNSPASFMRMMLSIFVDLNFSSLLCYLDDLLVFAPSERQALDRLELVFQRLRQHNLKLSPKKCNFLRTSVKVLGYVINGDGVAGDPTKVDVIFKMTKSDLMEEDGCAPSFQVMLGRVPRLPVDIMFKQVLRDPVLVDYSSYVKTLKSHLHEAVSITQQHTVKEQQKQAKHYDRKVRSTHLNKGDRVLLAKKRRKGEKRTSRQVGS